MMKFSEKEKRLLRHFGFVNWVLDDKSDSITEVFAYRQIAYECFVNGVDPNTKESQSLRRCCKALDKCTPYRMTPEWDALIEFEADEHDPWDLGWTAQGNGQSKDTNPYATIPTGNPDHWRQIVWDEGWEKHSSVTP